MRRRASILSVLLLAPALIAAKPVPTSKGPFTPTGPLAGVVLQKVATGLVSLTSVTHAGDARLFLTRRDGLVLVFESGAVRSQPFLDLRALTTNEGERGLLSIAFHPRHAENGFFFVDYTDLAGNVVLARYEISASDPNQADPGSGVILLTIPKTTDQHNGGQLHFGPDGYLYVSVGDNAGRTADEVCAAQATGTLLGKILRLDVDTGADAPPYYSIPAGNPFRENSLHRPEVWASGLRNPWRFSFDRATGEIYIGDVGATLREEVNVQPAGSPGGQNYGWKVMEGTSCFRSNNCPAGTPPCNSPLFTSPALEYEHKQGQCSITGGYVYRGTSLPQIHGTYVFGDLCTGRVWGADRRGTAWQVREAAARIPFVTAFGEGRNGEIWAVTYDGSLYRLAAQGPVDTVGVYEPSTALFSLRNLHLAGAADRTLTFGAPGLQPLAGDWDGNKSTTVGVWNPATGLFQLRNSLTPGAADVSFLLTTQSGAVALAGDWNGDGRNSIGFYVPANQSFLLKNALAAGRVDTTFRFPRARNNAIPLVGDWNGDGRDTVGLFDPATSTVRLKNTFKGSKVDVEFKFGPPASGWLPVVGDWDGDGRDSVGFYDLRTGTFRLKNDLKNGTADWVFRFGAGGGVPLAGEW